MGQQKLNDMLATHIAFFDKDGLRYDGVEKEIHFKHFFFVKVNDLIEASSKCGYCHKLGYLNNIVP